MEQALLDRTYDLLDRSELHPDTIAKGAKVGREWLKKLKGRKIHDPSVRRIQRVHDYLMVAPESEDSKAGARRSRSEGPAPAPAGR